MSLPKDIATEDEQALAEAAEWVLRLRDPAVSQAQIAEWLAWHDASAENQLAYAQMQSLWSRAGQLDEHEPAEEAVATDAYFGQVPITEWNERVSRAAPPVAQDKVDFKRRSQPFPRRVRWLLGATAAAAIVVVAIKLPLRAASRGQCDRRGW